MRKKLIVRREAVRNLTAAERVAVRGGMDRHVGCPVINATEPYSFCGLCEPMTRLATHNHWCDPDPDPPPR